MSSTGRALQEEVEPATAVLYPFFFLGIGVLVYLVLTRYVPWLPYTAVLFLLGTFTGIGVTMLGNENLLAEGIYNFWLKIDSEVLLLSFLPGLVFKDSSSMDIHLFQAAFWQCILFAFPMVLAGTSLTALVAYYIFPYDWSFPFSMTIGSILSATDPVAVASLLDAVGAPPRIKIHIGGESLLNDGSAIVFFTIFSGLYLAELDVLGLGENYDLGAGVKLFVRMSFAGAAIGAAFGLALLFVMQLLSRRLSREENVTQVGLTIAAAYLCYFTADAGAGTSGVIAVCTMGVIFASFGQALLNDRKLYDDVWALVEWLLNTVLFSLGGLVWGSIISNSDDENPDREFVAKDWGYLFVLYILLTVIRYFLMFSFFPITKRIGLGSTWQECFFQAFGGLRGAVGISLAIFLDNVVKRHTPVESKFQLQTTKLFGMVGGIAFLSLVLNGATAGPLLRKLGLADSTDVRMRMLQCYKANLRKRTIAVLVRLLAQRRFRFLDFNIAFEHIPWPDPLPSKAEIVKAADEFHAANKHRDHYRKPDLTGIMEYLKAGGDEEGEQIGSEYLVTPEEDDISSFRDVSISKPIVPLSTDMTLAEQRALFLNLVRTRYQAQIDDGELAGDELVVYTLFQSLDFAIDEASKGKTMCDWKYLNLAAEITWEKSVHKLFSRTRNAVDLELLRIRFKVEQYSAYMTAHLSAQQLFKSQFTSDQELGSAALEVVQESEDQVKEAEQILRSFPPDEVKFVLSLTFEKILLNNGVSYIEDLVDSSLLKSAEAEKALEAIQEGLKENMKTLKTTKIIEGKE